MPDPSPALLADLLVSLFDADELRIYLAREPEGIPLVDALPGNVSSFEALAHEAARALVRRGLVTREFFARLETARPHRRDRIRDVCHTWFSGPEPASGALWADRYRLEGRIGDGGFASVWRAVDEQTGKRVALKVLHPRHADDARVRQRFFRGAQTLATLSHPAIVRVLATASAEGPHCFYAMEYVRGVTLEVCVRERRRPRPVLLAVALQIGEALAHVHRHGLLHRDVKPGNILVGEQDAARLIDFDLVTGEEYLTLTTAAVGTGIYMPPEAHTSDRKTTAYDVYSLARTIEFILRGREPTARELTDVTDVPASTEVRAILRAALQPDPQRRIADMGKFCAELRAALGEPAPAPAPAPDESEAVRVDLGAAPVRLAAMGSIAAYLGMVVMNPPPSAAALLGSAVFIAGPSVRVLLDREDHKILTALHWLCVALWFPLGYALLSTTCGSHTATTVKTGPAICLFVGLVLGLYASITYLRRPRAG